MHFTESFLKFMETHQKFLITVLTIAEISAFLLSNFVAGGGLRQKRPQTWDSVDEQDHAHAHSSSSKSIFATCPLSTFKSGLFLKLHHLFSFQFGNPSISHQPQQEPPLTSPACVHLRQWCFSCHALSLISVVPFPGELYIPQL